MQKLLKYVTYLTFCSLLVQLTPVKAHPSLPGPLVMTSENVSLFLKKAPSLTDAIMSPESNLTRGGNLTDGNPNDALIRRANRILELFHATCELENLLPQQPNARSSAKAGILTGALLGGTAHTLGTRKRGPFDLQTTLAVALGGALVAGGVYWWIGEELQTIVLFRPQLERALEGLHNQQKLTKELRESHQELAQRIDETIIITDELKKYMPQVVAATGDNARLAEILDFVVKRQTQLEESVAYLLKRFDPEGKDLLSKQVTLSEETKRKAAAVNAYNQGRLLGRTSKFGKIPQAWLKAHGYEDLS